MVIIKDLIFFNVIHLKGFFGGHLSKYEDHLQYDTDSMAFIYLHVVKLK